MGNVEGVGDEVGVMEKGVWGELGIIRVDVGLGVWWGGDKYRGGGCGGWELDGVWDGGYKRLGGEGVENG